MKWYEKQKKLFAEQNDGETNQEANIYQEDEDTEEKLEKAFTESVESVQADEEVVSVSYETSDDMPYSSEDTLEEVVELSKTIISKDTRIQGNLEMNGDLFISGEIIGNVTCSGNLKIDGIIHGNVEGKNIILNTAQVDGDINCLQAMEIINESSITGNVSAGSLNCDGQVKGDIKVNGDLFIMHHAQIEGNIEAQSLQSEKGARLKGQCSVLSLS